MSKRRKRRDLWLVCFVLTSILTILWWTVIQFHYDYRNIPRHHLIGNRPSAVAALKEKGFPFSFVVIGDTRGTEVGETLIEKATQEESSSFMVILGDFVSKPDLWNHRFFLTEMTTEIKPSFPVFLAPGNHDIDYTSKIAQRERRVTPEVFESLYGARNFDFVFNQCLFIICGIDGRDPKNYLDYLHNTLSQKGMGKKHIFVFIHFPPKGLASYIKGPLPFDTDFFSCLETYKVTTCFFGDYHGYWRGEKRGLNLIITGGGGGRLRPSQPDWGKFHHMLRVTVDRDKLAEEMIPIQGDIGLQDLFEEWIFTVLFPVIQGFYWILYPVFVFLLILSGFSFLKFLTVLRHG